LSYLAGRRPRPAHNVRDPDVQRFLRIGYLICGGLGCVDPRAQMPGCATKVPSCCA
jgi:hypothetical protein